MKKLLMIIAVIAMASPAAAQLVITGAFDGPLTGGVPKGVELYACSDIADLSIYGIGSANNGGGTDGPELIFPADAIAGGTFLYVAYEDVEFTNFFGFAPDYVDGSMGINGDDAVELFLVDGAEPVCVDVFGDINMDGTGEPWDHLDSWAKRNTMTGPDGDVFILESWSFAGPNAWDGETSNDTAMYPFPLGGYECDPVVGAEDRTWDGVKSLYR